MSRPYSGTIAGVTIEDGEPVEDAANPLPDGFDAQAWTRSVRSYANRHGLAVENGKLVVLEAEDVATIDSRDVTTQPVGTRLRDAAVNPKPVDYLPPTNAGLADPHGPLVVSPGIHGAPGRPVTPGPVAPAAEQERVETADSVEVRDVEVAEPPRSGSGSAKDAWVVYAISQGADPDEAGLLTRDALIEQYGSAQA